MLTARNAQLAVENAYTRIGLPLKSISNAAPFVQPYDNYTGGQAGIGNFNAFMNPSGALITKIFYGYLSWGIINDNLGITNHYIDARWFHDLPGASWAFSFYYAKTLNSAVSLFDARAGTTAPVLVQSAGLTSKSQLAFDGYVFDITQ
jgi:hypothetical protein